MEDEPEVNDQQAVKEKCFVMEGDNGPSVQFVKPNQKSDLYPNVRNQYSKESPIIESNSAVKVNPNTFSRVKKVLDEILDKSGICFLHVSLLYALLQTSCSEPRILTVDIGIFHFIVLLYAH